MAESKTNTAPSKATVTRLRNTVDRLTKENNKLQDKIEDLEASAYCSVCGEFKTKRSFYKSTDILRKSGVTPICKQCANNIAERVDRNGGRHSVTKESLIQALRYLDKPFFESLYESSIMEHQNTLIASNKRTIFTSYIKNVAMPQYEGKTFADSDFFQEAVSPIIYEDEKDEEYLKEKDEELYNQHQRDKNDTIRLLGYDPFEKELVEDQPFLYAQLLGMLDQSEEQQDDMLRTSSIITIVRSFLQISKLDNNISKLMSDYENLDKHAAAIKSLQESKDKLRNIITGLAAESCISLKNSKNTKKGENTWTGKIKRLKDMNLREAEVNGFDMNTCRGMQQVMDLSHNSILKSLQLDESEYSDMLAEQRDMIYKLQKDLDSYKEISRILLRENLDLKDYLEKNDMLKTENLVDLTKLYSCFSEQEDGLVISDEKDDSDDS